MASTFVSYKNNYSYFMSFEIRKRQKKVALPNWPKWNHMSLGRLIAKQQPSLNRFMRFLTLSVVVVAVVTLQVDFLFTNKCYNIDSISNLLLQFYLEFLPAWLWSQRTSLEIIFRRKISKGNRSLMLDAIKTQLVQVLSIKDFIFKENNDCNKF